MTSCTETHTFKRETLPTLIGISSLPSFLLLLPPLSLSPLICSFLSCPPSFLPLFYTKKGIFITSGSAIFLLLTIAHHLSISLLSLLLLCSARPPLSSVLLFLPSLSELVHYPQGKERRNMETPEGVNFPAIIGRVNLQKERLQNTGK